VNSKPICIIPARGGSKRIPRKNIAEFNGKPLIAWSIENALESKIFSDVIVSTDDNEIAAISKQFGANIPFMRSVELADDFTTTADVLLDALNRLEVTDYACCLYPTAPLLKHADFKNAFTKLQNTKADCIISVTEFDFHPLRAFETNENGNIKFKWPENALTRSQDLPNLVHDAGAFYFFNSAAFQKQQNLMMEKTIGYAIERTRAIDIDTPEDFELAQELHKLHF